MSRLHGRVERLERHPPVPVGAGTLSMATVRRIISKGIERGEVRPSVDVETWTSVMIATLEGAVMLSRLYQDTVHMRRAVEYIRHCIERDLA